MSKEGKLLRRIQKELVNNVWEEGKKQNKEYSRCMEKEYSDKK
jgi:hypothetical protein